MKGRMKPAICCTVSALTLSIAKCRDIKHTRSDTRKRLELSCGCGCNGRIIYQINGFRER